MSVSVNTASRLMFGELSVVDGIEFWDTLVLPDNNPRQDDIQYTVQSSDRIDLIAQRFYQDPVMWWVIAWANDLEILPTDMKTGQLLNIPSKAFIETSMARRRT